jgi:thioredoxin-like negative regulator of GroEL
MRRPAAVLAFVLLALLSPGLSAGEEKPPPLAADPLAAQARSGKKVFIADFGLGTCFSCRQQKKVLDNIDNDYRGKVFIRFVHVSKEAAIADLHGVTEVPTLLFYAADGSIAMRQVGGMNYLQIAAQLEKMGVKP